MKAWSVLIFGEGFVRGTQKCDFELAGVVHASDPNAAFHRAVAKAEALHPELSQVTQPRPGPVINADEINELPSFNVAEEIELFWSPSNEA